MTPLPALDVRLIGPSGEDDILVILDTGAEYCLFDGRRAPALGLSLTAGRHIHMHSLGGELDVYIHEIEVEIIGERFRVEAAFSPNPVQRELLGRQSLFGQTTWAIRESRQEIYFSPRP